MEPEAPATESGGDGLARQPAKEVGRTTKLSAAAAEHLELEQDEGESLREFAARYVRCHFGFVRCHSRPKAVVSSEDGV